MDEELTIGRVIEHALAAYEALTSLGEDVEDEWTYVMDLSAVWRERLEGVVAARGAEVVEPAVSAAIYRAIDEIGQIRDPQRAIDWLSTYPQVVLAAVGEEP